MTSGDRFRLLAERSPDVVYRVRTQPTFGFEYVSPAITNLIGWTPEDLYADPNLVFQLVFPEDLEHVRAMFEGRVGPEESQLLRWRRRDGIGIWTEQRLTQIVEGGQVVAVEGTARDITERIEAHERLRRSEERLRAMLEAVDIVAVAMDREGRITFANPHVCRLIGRTQDELLGLDWFDACVPEDERAQLRERFEDALTAAEPAFRFDSGLVTPSGEVRRINWSSAPILDASGAVTGCVALGDDVTESRQARALEKRLTAAVEQTAESVVITDTDARIVYVNPAFERITGYTSEEVLGLNPRVLQSGRHDKAFFAEMWATLTAGGTWAGDLVNRRKDGRLYFEEATITPIRDGAGVITNFVAVKRDVTLEHEMQSSLESAQAERLAVARILSEFEPGESLEATADAFVTAVAALPDIAAVWIVTFEPDGRAIIFAGAPATFPGAFVGSEVPPGPAAELSARTLEGPWVGPWVGPWLRQPDSDSDFFVASQAGGITAASSVSIGAGQTPAAFLRIATSHADGVDRLKRYVPALAELAAGARPLLEPGLRARWQAVALTARLRTLLSEGAFDPVFQPIVRLDDLRIVGFEALTRFRDGSRADDVFAEAAGVGLGLDLEIATLEAAIHASGALPDGTWLSLNVSPRVLLADGRLRTALARRSRPTVLELTEHERVDDYAALRSAIVALGPDLRIAVDDAGAGVANFSHLVELRPDFVKVDIGLVRGVNADLTRQALIVGLRHFAQATDRDVIAEGIETEAERRTLQALGINLGQGFLLGRPAPVADWTGAKRAAR